MNVTNMLFRSRQLVMFIVTWIGFVSYKFILRYDENNYNYKLKYQNAADMIHDCNNNFFSAASFVEECKKAYIFISKPRWIRSLTDTLSEMGPCGLETCIDYFLGPDLSFSGRMVQIAICVFFVWFIMFLIVQCKYAFRSMERMRTKAIYPFPTYKTIENPKIHKTIYNNDTAVTFNS